MAEAWTRKLMGHLFEAFSAGVETHGLNPNAVEVMKEAGVDMSMHKSKNVSAFIKNGVSFDYVVTVCDNANESCPFFPGKTKRIHAGFEDPPKLAENAKTREEALKHYRKVCNEIKKWVEKLPEVLE